jgi:sensor histidine kinase regulating citrate/malate metabolism
VGAIVSVFVVRNILRTLEEKTRYREQVQTIRYLEEVIKAMRIQRHSFNHELQVVYGLIAVEAYAEAKEYLEKTRIKTALTNNSTRIPSSVKLEFYCGDGEKYFSIHFINNSFLEG